MHILLVAFSAPPKNSAEAIQTSRFLRNAAATGRKTLITTSSTAGWARSDPGLNLKFEDLSRIELRLPLHAAAQRVLANRRLSALHVPDAEWWATWMSAFVRRRLSEPVDVVYSRSGPMSGAVLAEKLARELGRRWLMHLSDPWAGSPYRISGPKRAARDKALEARCVAAADRISMTTKGQVGLMQTRYPNYAHKFFVSSNMMGEITGLPKTTAPGTPLELVHTGSFYLDRKPDPFLEAIERIAACRPNLISQLNVRFFGNATAETANRVAQTPACCWKGPVAFDEALAEQRNADVLVTIEAGGGGTDPLYKHFMPSKNLDYIAAQRPIFAVTPDGSETSKLCAAGNGWSFPPNGTAQMADRLAAMIECKARGQQILKLPNPLDSPYRAERVTSDIVAVLRDLSSAP